MVITLYGRSFVQPRVGTGFLPPDFSGKHGTGGGEKYFEERKVGSTPYLSFPAPLLSLTEKNFRRGIVK